MITDKEIEEIRGYLDKAENPLFLFDDDPDGLCSFLLLMKHYKKGKGVAVKSSPVLGIDYLRKIDEYNPDFVFILDKPIVSQEFVDKVNVPVIWIDHHPLIHLKGIHYFNPRKNDEKDNRPTTYLCYKITEDDLWIATIGCIADWYIPEFIEEFMEKYPEVLDKKPKHPNEVVYSGNIGKIVKMFAFLLKNSITEVNKAISVLLKIDGINELIDEETARSKFIARIANNIGKKYDKLLEDAISKADDSEFLVYVYPYNRLAISSELSNELMIKYSNKTVIVARDKKDRMILSIRSMHKNVVKPLKKTLENFKDAYGGGHDNACGGSVRKEDFEKFVKEFKKNMS